MKFASWRKCDFQLHTPRDPNWQGERPVGLNDKTAAGSASKDQVDSERRAWAKEFVDICIKKHLRAIAVTDHHEMVMIFWNVLHRPVDVRSIEKGLKVKAFY